MFMASLALGALLPPSSLSHSLIYVFNYEYIFFPLALLSLFLHSLFCLACSVTIGLS